MGGFFGGDVASAMWCSTCFLGVDYHSHLGTRRAGMVFCEGTGGFSEGDSLHRERALPFAL